LIKSTLEDAGISIACILLTHWHGDHTGGVPALVEMFAHLENHVYKNDPDKGQQNIADGQVGHVEGATVRAIHVPGHSTDHMCFILEEEQAMFTGDNILGHGTSAVEDLGTFMGSLQKMLNQEATTGYPAHGITIDDLPGKIRGELEQKLKRERQVMQGLSRVRERGGKSVTVPDLVTEIYGKSLDEKTRTLALEPFIGEVLKKMAGDSAVAFEMRQGRKKWFGLSLPEPKRTEQPKAPTPAPAIKVQ